MRTSPAVELSGTGPGEELVAHLAAVLDGLENLRGSSVVLPDGDDDLLVRMLDAQMGSRWLDVAARRMRARAGSSDAAAPAAVTSSAAAPAATTPTASPSVVSADPVVTSDPAAVAPVAPARYPGQAGPDTSASAGHEANAAVALAIRTADPALLHYRSGGFYLARSLQAGHTEGLLDIALGLVGSADEPISGGRHPVLGHPELAVIPQTPTAASHLPRALGAAWAIGRQAGLPARLRRPLRWRDDALVVAGFGDAAANHSTATGAINAACWAARQGIPLPLLLVCEDNGLGMSVRTPEGWIQGLYENRPGLEYRYADGYDPVTTLAVAREAAETARTRQVPVLLHLSTVRIGGHTGADHELAYRSAVELGADLARDPLAACMRAVVTAGLLTPADVRRRWTQTRDAVAHAVGEALRRSRPTSVDQLTAPLAPQRPGAVRDRASWVAAEEERRRVFGDTLPEEEPPLTLAESINRTLLDAGAAAPHLVLLGPDVARLGGPFGVTRGLQRRLGASRVVDTLLDEQSVLGLALGSGLAGLLPVAEISFLAYLHNAADQIRGEAATLQFFSQGAYRNPLVVRVAGLADPSGAGGHFHNDNAVAALRDVPGLVVACPAHPCDAPALVRTCLAAAEVDGAVAVILEPHALYHERDLLDGDGGWTARYQAPEGWDLGHVPVGRASTWGNGRDLTIATFGNGLRLSLRAAERLSADGVGVRVVDLRWLRPLPVTDVLREARETGRLLIVD
ncbi:MAG: thiamine pyrophosphate-dependent enzyme, partial [Kineosporiaceae bacterium]